MKHAQETSCLLNLSNESKSLGHVRQDLEGIGPVVSPHEGGRATQHPETPETRERDPHACAAAAVVVIEICLPAHDKGHEADVHLKSSGGSLFGAEILELPLQARGGENRTPTSRGTPLSL